jgi:hypothetical protein
MREVLGRCDSDHLDIGCQSNGDHALLQALADTDAGVETAGHHVAEAVVDTMPVGGFGNLIALPLQRRARELGNSVFVDQDLRPYDDQWAFLAARPRLSAKAAAEIVDKAETRGRILGVPHARRR